MHWTRSNAWAGNGPTLIECRTYRTRPHAEGMVDGGYRTQEEIDAWKARDPIEALARKLSDDGVGADALEAVGLEVAEEITEAVQFATDSPWPSVESVTDHIYSDDLKKN